VFVPSDQTANQDGADMSLPASRRLVWLSLPINQDLALDSPIRALLPAFYHLLIVAGDRLSAQLLGARHQRYTDLSYCRTEAISLRICH
jgi:hypothetical protein